MMIGIYKYSQVILVKYVVDNSRVGFEKEFYFFGRVYFSFEKQGGRRGEVACWGTFLGKKKKKGRKGVATTFTMRLVL